MLLNSPLRILLHLLSEIYICYFFLIPFKFHIEKREILSQKLVVNLNNFLANQQVSYHNSRNIMDESSRKYYLRLGFSEVEVNS